MISIADLLQHIPISRTTFDELVKEGAFPKPCYVTPMKLGFFPYVDIQWQQGLTRVDDCCGPVQIDQRRKSTFKARLSSTAGSAKKGSQKMQVQKRDRRVIA